jgi:D-glycero-D-manno-heptose 1,7-bisphosphate phosphatase
VGKQTLMSQPAVFLDRDGTINENVLNVASGKWEAPLTVAQLRLLPGAVNALRALQEAGYALVLVSNQPNHALGKASLESMAAIHDSMTTRLANTGVTFTDAYYCHHHPDGHTPGFSGPCVCRKPSPHFLNHAASCHKFDMACSWMVGDRGTDVACGKAAGVHTILLTSQGYIPPHPGQEQPDAVLPSLAEAVRLILGKVARVG